MSDKPIGYSNPPFHSRFKKGQSGNPGGRKKDSRNFKTVLDEVMAREVEQSGNRKKKPVPLLEALLLKQADCGLKGDWRATERLLDRYERYSLDRPDSQGDLPEEDKHMLDDFLGRRLGRRSSAEEPEDDNG
jgi:hypothetical protein